jgi:hypothetical protein
MTFRSQEMAHYRLIVPRENSYNTLESIIQLEMVHLVDISDNLNRPFFPQIKRCDEILQKI